MHQKETYCIGGRHHSNTFERFEYVKRNPKTNKIVQVKKENAIFVV